MNTLAERFQRMHGNRQTKLNRARYCSAVTVPTLLPPEGWSEGTSLPQPYSSVGSRGVTGLASRILSALMPLNDTPFFKFQLRDGSQAPPEIQQYLDTLSFQVYNKLSSTNLRETVYQALQHLIVTGDVLIEMDSDYFFTIYRLDQYSVQRDIMGEVLEVIHLEYEVDDPEFIDYSSYSDIEHRVGYKTYYCQYLRQDDGTWAYSKENAEGEVIEAGIYLVVPMAVLRWYAIAGENYGRSHCEDILGDLNTLEAYTKAQIEGMAAASAFWIAVDPQGITEVDDLAGVRNGSFVAAKATDISVISPAGTIQPQVAAAAQAVENMRREVGQAFLMTGQAIPSGDRVTATAVRMIGQELETVLGGAFSSIARTLMEPIVKRCIVQMLEDKLLDERLTEQFFDNDGTLTVNIVTGLQALSRDSDLQKLMQMGEMVRNLPPDALATFKWDSYSSALITALGFDARNWVKSQDEIAQERTAAQAMQVQADTASAVGTGIASSAQDLASAAVPALMEQQLQ